jgi:hypothetical protein
MNDKKPTRSWWDRNSYITGFRYELQSIASRQYGSFKLAAEAAPHLFKQVRDAWRRYRRELAEDRAIPADARRELAAQMDKDARAMIAAIWEGTQSNAATYRAQLQPPPRTRSETEELAYERRRRQLFREIEAGADVGELLAVADREALDVLAEEMISVIKAETRGDASMFKNRMLALMDAVDKRRREIASPEEARRYAELDRLNTGLYRSEVGAKHLDHAIMTGDLDFDAIPGWSEADGLLRSQAESQAS